MTTELQDGTESIRARLRITFCEAARAEALSVLRALLGAVRTHTGCLATHLTQDVTDDRTLTWVEEWRSMEDFERHLRSDAFRRVLAVMDLGAERPAFEVIEVRRRHGFELVESLLGAGPASEIASRTPGDARHTERRARVGRTGEARPRTPSSTPHEQDEAGGR